MNNHTYTRLHVQVHLSSSKTSLSNPVDREVYSADPINIRSEAARGMEMLRANVERDSYLVAGLQLCTVVKKHDYKLQIPLFRCVHQGSFALRCEHIMHLRSRPVKFTLR